MFLLLGAHTSPPHRCAQLFSLNIIKSELPIMLLSQYRSMPFFLNSKTFTNVSAAVCRQSVISDWHSILRVKPLPVFQFFWQAVDRFYADSPSDCDNEDFPFFGKWLFEASPGGLKAGSGVLCIQIYRIKSEPHSEACKDPAGNMLFLQLIDQQRVHLWNIPGQTPRPPKALWIEELVWGVFQYLHSIYCSAGLLHCD